MLKNSNCYLFSTTIAITGRSTTTLFALAKGKLISLGEAGELPTTKVLDARSIGDFEIER